MKQDRPEARRGRFAPIAVAGFSAAIYLAVLFWKNASAFRDVRSHWARDLARESGTAGVIWLVLAAGVATLVGTVLMRRSSVAVFLIVGISVGCLGLECAGLLERLKYNRMLEGMTNLRQVGLQIAADSKSSVNGLPEDLPSEVVAGKAWSDGWGHPPRYVRLSPTHAFIIAPGSDGRFEVNVESVKSEVFPPSRFEHDIVGEIVNDEFSFVVYPNGPAQGIPCAIYSAFGCLSFWR